MPAETHVEQGPLDRNEVFEIVRDRLADILEIEPATITEGQSFVDDLDADSLALIELVEALEEELERAHRRLPHRGRGPRRPEDGARRRRLRPRPRGQGRLIALDVTASDVAPTPAGVVRRRGDVDVMALVRRLGTASPTRPCSPGAGPPLVVRGEPRPRQQRAARVPRRRRARLGRRRPRLPHASPTCPRAS